MSIGDKWESEITSEVIKTAGLVKDGGGEDGGGGWGEQFGTQNEHCLALFKLGEVKGHVWNIIYAVLQRLSRISVAV